VAGPEIICVKDAPNCAAAMGGDEMPEHWEGMKHEIASLVKRKTWPVVDRPDPKDHFVAPGAWAFKRKRRPDGAVTKHRSRFCVRGDVQKCLNASTKSAFQLKEEACAPVVSWATVRLMLILSVILGLTTLQIDFSNAFAQASIPADKPVYVELPARFPAIGTDYVDKSKVLKLQPQELVRSGRRPQIVV